MSDLNLVAVLVAAVAAFVTSTVWYAVAGAAQTTGADGNGGRPPAWMMLVELARSLTVAVVVAWLVTSMEVSGWVPLIGVALALWLAFPVVLLVGSVMWERVPWRVAASHGGDWLVKLVVITLIVGVWR